MLSHPEMHHWGGCTGWLLEGGHPVSIPGSTMKGGCNVIGWWLQRDWLVAVRAFIYEIVDVLCAHTFVKTPP